MNCIVIIQRPCQLAWAFLLYKKRGENDVTKKDIRTLCNQHAKEMIYAKFALIRTDCQWKTECDKCPRQGYQYELKNARLSERKN